MIFLFIPAWLIPLLPKLIGAMGGIGASIASKQAVDKMNRYNSPSEQVKRLQAAGLPFAAFEAGQAGQQSQIPDFSGIERAGDSIGDYFNTRLQAKQYDLMTEQIRDAINRADLSGFDRDIKGEEHKAAIEPHEGFMDGRSRAKQNKLYEYGIREFESFIKRNESSMQNIDAALKEAQFNSNRLSEIQQEEFNKLVWSNKLAQQIWESNNAKNAAQLRIVESMKEGGLNLAEAFLLQILQGLTGRLNTPIGGLGF